MLQGPDMMEVQPGDVVAEAQSIAEPQQAWTSETDQSMNHEGKTKEKLTRELTAMRRRVAHLEAAETERKRAAEALRQQNRELTLLNRVSQELTAMLDRRRVAEQLLHEVTEAIGAEDASVWLQDEEGDGWLTCWTAVHHEEKRSPVNLRLRPGQGVAGWVVQTGKSVVVPRVSEDPRFAPAIDEQTGFRTTSLLATPLRARSKVIGVLEVVNKLEGDFDADDLALVETLAAPAAIAIDNARLVEALHQRTAELEARNRELDTFAETVAHDLKNPLALIIAPAEALEQCYDVLTEEEVRTCARLITQNGHKMSSIIDALLLLAKVPYEEVEAEPLDMASIVAEVQQRLASTVEELHAEILLPETWPVVLGYGPWVEEVWANYLSNALKYGGRPDEGLPPRVELGSDDGAVARPGGMASPTVRFWVRDNGPGIPHEHQARLFVPFSQLHRDRVHSHGLGLSIVQRIVEKLGGQVGVESEVGVGSTFWFTLPAAA